jgi:hypothetical protein
MGIYSGDGMRGEGEGGGNIPIVQGWRLYRRSTTVRARRLDHHYARNVFVFSRKRSGRSQQSCTSTTARENCRQ